MTSPAPLEYGQYYHIYNRGNNGENLFFEERNYPYFLKLYARHIGSRNKRRGLLSCREKV